MELLIVLISGAVAASIAGGGLKFSDLGFAGNSITGIIGGGLGGQALAFLRAGVLTDRGPEVSGLLEQVVAGGAGGLVVLAAAGLVKNAVAK